jgi:hypothetical protein
MRSIVQIKKDMKHVMELSRFLELYGQASDECTFSQKTLDWHCDCHDFFFSGDKLVTDASACGV